jgi:putative CocE/NonD family hydrolase
MGSEITVEKSLLVPMRDGTRLAADLYRPAAAGVWPAAVSCYPYHKDGMIGASFVAAMKRFARAGYAGLLVDCRGTGGSDGIGIDALEPIATMDLYDLVEWIAGQTWCTGKVGMWGISYGGITALKAASLHPPHLTAIAPIYGVTDFYRTWLVPGGRPNLLGNMGAWMPFMQAMNLTPPLHRDGAGRWRSLWEARLAAYQPYLIEGLDHLEASDDYWTRTAIDAATITTPTLVISGWRDVFLDDGIEQFRKIQAPKRLLVGPWVHMLPNLSVVEALDHETEILRWFDHWLKGEETGVMREPAVRVYVQGEGGGWRFDDDFPPGGTARRFYPQEDHRLGEQPAANGVDVYRAVHTVGVKAGLASPMPMGLDYPQDQRRDDGLSLTYTSAPLGAALEIAGRPVVRLTLSCSWDDPTLALKLCDVAPDGASTLVTSGWLAPRVAAVSGSAVVASQGGIAGRRLSVEVPLWHTAYRFAPGHRLRLAVACSDFPRLWPGRGTGTIEVDRSATELRVPSVAPERQPGGSPSFEPPDLMALLSEGPVVFVPSWRIEGDVIGGTVATRAGLEMKLMTPTGAYLESSQGYVARAGSGDRAETTLEATYTLDVTQDGEAIAVAAHQRMTESEIELESTVRVAGRERYRREWRRDWRRP